MMKKKNLYEKKKNQVVGKGQICNFPEGNYLKNGGQNGRLTKKRATVIRSEERRVGKEC